MIYVSRSLIGADPATLDAIVSAAMVRNAKDGLTGMLWADGQSFAQAIEGDPEKLGMTMERIRADPRHTECATVSDRAVLSRQFGSWSMRQAFDDPATDNATAFIIGFAMGERSPAAARLYETVLACDRPCQ